jgi:hypothetical protein
MMAATAKGFAAESGDSQTTPFSRLIFASRTGQNTERKKPKHTHGESTNG